MKKLNQLTIDELWETFNKLCGKEVSNKNPIRFQHSIPHMKHELTFKVLEDNDKDYIITVSRIHDPKDVVVLRCVGGVWSTYSTIFAVYPNLITELALKSVYNE